MELFHNVISKVYSNFSDGFDYLDSLSTQPNLDKSYIDRTKTILNELQKNKSLSLSMTQIKLFTMKENLDLQITKN